MKKWLIGLLMFSGAYNQNVFAQEGSVICLIGDCKNGFSEAMIVTDDTVYYSGNFVDGMMEGKGRLNSPGNFYYLGQFKQNSMNGKGMVSLESGDIYDGIFVNSAFEGEGTYTYKNGETMIGTFKSNEIWNGKGYIQLSEKAYYKGEIKEGKRNGEGFMQLEDGSSYKGTFLADEMTGSGTIHYADGRYYIGEVLDGYCHGNGKIYSASNELEFEGEWIKNEPQPKVKTPYEIFSPIFNECFNGYQKSKINGEEVITELKVCFTYNYSGKIDAVSTTKFKIDGVDYYSKLNLEGRAYESDYTFYMDVKSVIQEDVLPYGLIWIHDRMSGSIYTNDNKSGGYILQGISPNGDGFEIMD